MATTEVSGLSSIEYLIWTITKSPAAYVILRDNLKKLQNVINETEQQYKKENNQ